MKMQVQAKIYWLSTQEGGRIVLPTSLRYVTVDEFEGLVTSEIAESWSLVVESMQPFKQNEWNIVTIGFLNHKNAPQHVLKQGQRFQLREGRRVVATGEIIETEAAVAKLNGRSVTLPEQVATHRLT